MRTIAKDLVARGYEVCFVSGSGYREYVEAIGASFVPVEGYGDFYDLRARDLDPDCMIFSVFYDLFLIYTELENISASRNWNVYRFRVSQISSPDRVN